MSKLKIQDADMAVHEIDINLDMFRKAEANGMANGMRQLDAEVPTNADQPTASQQVYAHLGLARAGTTMKDAMDMKHYQHGDSAASTQDGSVTGRLVVQAYLMDTIESSLRESDYGLTALFTKKAAVVDSITGTKFDRPILDFTRPAAARAKPIAQLSEPTRMLLLTTSGRSYAIPGEAIGIEYSDQAAANVTIPIVALSMQRQAEEAAAERAEESMLDFLIGNTDVDMAALSAVPGATKNAKTDYDSTIAANGVLTQKAWVKWLFDGSRKRKIDTVITNIDGALAIENRTGRPNVNSDNGTTKRIDTLESVVNPTWPDKVDVVISQDSAWPANTIVGFDSRYGYHIVNSTSMAYSGVESFATRRSTKLRIDSGSISYRLFDDAWSVLTLTV